MLGMVASKEAGVNFSAVNGVILGGHRGVWSRWSLLTSTPAPHWVDPDDQDDMDLSELLAKHDQGDFLRSVAEAVLQLIM